MSKQTMQQKPPEVIDLDKLFSRVEISSERLRRLVLEVLSRMSAHEDLDQIDFGCLIEEPTFSGRAGEVDNEGVHLDSRLLDEWDDELAMALIAHELAHRVLRHHQAAPHPLAQEREADACVQRWGLDLERFRRLVGPPRLFQCKPRKPQ